jgi:hypothetical protein
MSSPLRTQRISGLEPELPPPNPDDYLKYQHLWYDLPLLEGEWMQVFRLLTPNQLIRFGARKAPGATNCQLEIRVGVTLGDAPAFAGTLNASSGGQTFITYEPAWQLSGSHAIWVRGAFLIPNPQDVEIMLQFLS